MNFDSSNDNISSGSISNNSRKIRKNSGKEPPIQQQKSALDKYSYHKKEDGSKNVAGDKSYKQVHQSANKYLGGQEQATDMLFNNQVRTSYN